MRSAMNKSIYTISIMALAIFSLLLTGCGGTQVRGVWKKK